MLQKLHHLNHQQHRKLFEKDQLKKLVKNSFEKNLHHRLQKKQVAVHIQKLD